MASSSSGVSGGEGPGADSGGSRAAELRAAKLQMKAMQQQQQQKQQQQEQQGSSVGVGPSPFGAAPSGYVPGSGRGAGFKKDDDDDGGGPTGYDSFGGYNDKLFDSTPYDDDDEEADNIYEAIDDRMNGKKRGRSQEGEGGVISRVGDQFRELKEKLKDVTEDEWAAIPDVGDYSLRYKQKRREDVFTPITDSLLEARNKVNKDATASSNALAGTAQVDDGTASVAMNSVSHMSGLADARGTILGMSLDKMSDSVSGQTVVDPKGYLTSLSNTKIATSAEIGDINKARLLLKSVRDTNPKHGPGWIAAARVEEAAGKTLQARKLIQDGCEACPANEDVWLEAARLHPIDAAKTILATAVRRMPTSVKLFLRAADLENHDEAKKAVLRKALEANPSSVTLWKAMVELEEAEDAKILLSVAVEKVPHSVEMWLALARLESYENARKVLNQARKALPADRSIWIAAAKLEESQNHGDMVDKVIDRAVKSLAKHDAIVSRAQWLKDAESAEFSGAPLTAGAIVKFTLGMGVDFEDRQRTWSDDASGALSRRAVATARAILAHSLAAFPSKRSLWLQAVDLERNHGDAVSLDEVLAAASERLPKQEIFWLVRAKEKWQSGDIDTAREILTQAFAANPNSEPVWLAAVKLEWETGEIERARVLLKRARERASSERVYMKSALLERESKQFNDSLSLIEEGLSKYSSFPKLWMMGGQICSCDLDKSKAALDRARSFYQKGLKQCPNNAVLWILASRLEEIAPTFNEHSKKSSVGFTKARSLLEIARLKNPRNPDLWLESIRLERRAGNDKLAVALMARALQECPMSGKLLAENITTAPRVEQKSKSADAIKKCPDDPHVIAAVASLFAMERKKVKARKWFERAVVLNPDIGDSWAKYYAFELENGTKDHQEKVMSRCMTAEPKYGEQWCAIVKDMKNRTKTMSEMLDLVS
eukprot:CAMPEP_0184858404 /NCGR_PEP_ID=MMETSP0580-20130426/3511_1 /TAXON_ID=1118495 /ORGANISM="Dactyliosolen fragilissimus" /LENGTH=942 /DNA_ID=CAMNT_0027354529 /DNA_START=81 /DNA_END=2905 /DNA_ORIENTATION=-